MLEPPLRDGAVQLTGTSAPGAAGHVRRRLDRRQQRGLHRPAERVLDGWDERLGGRRPRPTLAGGAGAARAADVGDSEGIRADVGFPTRPRKFLEGIEKLGLAERNAALGIGRGNIHDCLGCGYCNIGCAYGRKALDARHAAAPGPERFGAERLRIFASARAEDRDLGRPRRPLACRLDGRGCACARTGRGRRRYDRSSYLLQRSRRAAAVGKGLAFNMGSPITAEFDDQLAPTTGFRSPTLLEPAGEAGFVMETWFNPVALAGAAMPGWFEDHRRNMRRYAHMAVDRRAGRHQPNGASSAP